MSIIYESRSHAIRSCLFHVQNDVGVGRDEEDYHKALIMCFRQNEIPFVSKQPHPLMLFGEEAHRLFPDFSVWQSITLELKAVPRRLGAPEFVQLFDYLKCRGDSLGLLVNMGLDRVFIDRVVRHPEQTRLTESWRYWSGQIDGKSREIGLAVRDVLREIFRQHETGYGTEVVSKLIHFGLRWGIAANFGKSHAEITGMRRR
ncbi:GxxExxY protein [Stieleria neptunia]|nr:GxxExxY protein [Stieleria neptunia]